MADCLPGELWRIIGEKLQVTADRIRFRSVCRICRSVMPFPQPPWLMLVEDDCTPYTRGFFGLRRSKDGDGVDEQGGVYQFELPELYQTRCVGSTAMWLITVDAQERIRLLNPLSRLQIDLPSQGTFDFRINYFNRDYEHIPKVLRRCLLKKTILSSPPSSSSGTGDCIAMAIHHFESKLAFARPGDACWTTVQTQPPCKNLFLDVIFYKNQFYAINVHRQLVVCDLGVIPPKAMMLTNDVRDGEPHHNIYYLVEWMEELLLVVKRMLNDENKRCYEMEGFDIYKFDFDTKKWNSFDDLGEYSLFLGYNTSIAVLACKYSGLEKNCVYFTDDYTWGYRGSKQIAGDRCMGVFDLKDSSVRVHYKGKSTHHPLWVVPHV